jgi:hypothetical protein
MIYPSCPSPIQKNCLHYEDSCQNGEFDYIDCRHYMKTIEKMLKRRQVLIKPGEACLDDRMSCEDVN